MKEMTFNENEVSLLATLQDPKNPNMLQLNLSDPLHLSDIAKKVLATFMQQNFDKPEMEAEIKIKKTNDL